MSAADGYDHIWRWKKWPRESWDGPGNLRCGQRCRVIVRGRGGCGAPRNIMVEFEDGDLIIAPRYAVRKVR